MLLDVTIEDHRVLARHRSHQSLHHPSPISTPSTSTIPVSHQECRVKSCIRSIRMDLNLLTYLCSNGNHIAILSDWTPCRCRTSIFNLCYLGHGTTFSNCSNRRNSQPPIVLFSLPWLPCNLGHCSVAASCLIFSLMPGWRAQDVRYRNVSRYSYILGSYLLIVP